MNHNEIERQRREIKRNKRDKTDESKERTRGMIKTRLGVSERESERQREREKREKVYKKYAMESLFRCEYLT